MTKEIKEIDEEEKDYPLNQEKKGDKAEESPDVGKRQHHKQRDNQPRNLEKPSR